MPVGLIRILFTVLCVYCSKASIDSYGRSWAFLVLGCSTCCHCFHIHCTTLFQAISALASKFNWRSNFSQLHSLLHCTLSSKPPGLPSALFWDHGTIQLGKEPSAYWSNHLVLLVSILWTSSWWNHRQYCLDPVADNVSVHTAFSRLQKGGSNTM